MKQHSLRKTAPVRLLEKMSQFCQQLATIQSLERTYQYIVATIMNSLPGVKFCAIYIIRADSHELQLAEYAPIFDEYEPPFKYSLGDGLPGEAAQSSQAIHRRVKIPFPVSDQGTNGNTMGYQHVAPLIISGSVIGVIDVYRLSHRRLSPAYIHMLNLIAFHAALAIQNKLIYQNVKHTNDEILQISRLSKEITTADDFNSLVDEILRCAHQSSGCTIASLWFMDPITRQWRRRTYPNVPLRNITLPEITSGQGIIGYVYQSGRAYRCDDTSSDSYYFDTWGTKSELALPLISENNILGILNVESHQRNAFSDRHFQTLSILAEEAAAAFRNIQLYRIADQKNQQFILMKELAEALSHQKHLKEILHIIARECAHNIGTCRRLCLILLVDRAKEVLETVAIAGEPIKRSFKKFKLPLKKQSISTSVFQSRLPRLEPDVCACSDYFLLSRSTKSEICVPIKFRNSVLGVINLESEESGAFHEADLDMMIALADSTALAVKIGELYDVRIKQLEALNKTAYMINSSFNLQNVLKTLAEAALQAIGDHHRTIYIQIVDEASRTLHVEAYAGEKVFPYHYHTMTVTEGISGEVIRTKKEYICQNVKLDKFYQKINPRIKSKLCVPILQNDQVVGIINVVSYKFNDFGEYDIQLLQGLATQAAIAIENARLNDRIANTQLQLTEEMELAVLGETLRQFSHDIRSCTTLISGEAQWIEKLYDKGTLSLYNAVESMGKIMNYVKRAEDLTRELSSRSQDAPPQFAPILVSTLIEELVPLFASRANRHRIDSKIETESLKFTIEMDSGRMKRALMNFIMNAIDAMPQGGYLHISGKRLYDVGCITVTDTGSGIAQEKLKHIWEPFFSTKRRGTGLGLSICKNIIEGNHKGKVSIDSRENEGTTVHIELPLRQKQHTN